MVFQQKNQMAQPGRVGSDSFGDIDPPQVSPLALAGPSFWTRSDRNKIPQKSISLLQNPSLQKTYRIMYIFYIYTIQYLFPLPIQKILQATYQKSPLNKPDTKKKGLEIILSGQTSAMPRFLFFFIWHISGTRSLVWGSWGSHSLHRANGALPGGFPPGTLRKPDRFHVVVKCLINV